MLARVTPIKHDNRPQSEAQLILMAPQQYPPNPLLNQTRFRGEQHRSLSRQDESGATQQQTQR
jgi:hypothetical protein